MFVFEVLKEYGITKTNCEFKVVNVQDCSVVQIDKINDTGHFKRTINNRIEGN